MRMTLRKIGIVFVLPGLCAFWSFGYVLVYLGERSRGFGEKHFERLVQELKEDPE